MKITITGGSGFVGSRLAQSLLEQGHQVTSLDSSRAVVHGCRQICGDIRDPATCDEAIRGADLVYHLAALYRDDVSPRSLYYEVNVAGTEQVAAAAARNGVRRIIFTSSFSVYGLQARSRDEDSGLSPSNDYGHSKLQAEQLLERWCNAAPDRSLAVIRPSVIFGEGGRGNVYTLLKQISTGRFVMIGSGANRKSMAYVGNIVAFLQFLLERPVAGVQIINYADKPDWSVSQIVSVACKELHRSVPRLPLPQALAVGIGRIGDCVNLLAGQFTSVTSERVRKFLADTTLPTQRLQLTGFVAPVELRDAFVRTIRAEFGS